MLYPLKIREGVLAPSVRIRNFINNDSVKDRVCLSQGTALAESAPDMAYEALARVPRKPWRLPSIDEKKYYLQKQPQIVLQKLLVCFVFLKEY